MKSRVLLVCLALFCQPAAAATFWCTGALNRILVYGNGDVMISPDWNASWVAICNVRTERLGVSTDTCKAWLTLIESAKAQGNVVGVIYNSGAYSCSTIPSYGGSPAPVGITPG